VGEYVAAFFLKSLFVRTGVFVFLRFGVFPAKAGRFAAFFVWYK
jgi:hypothetical protein